MASVILLPIGVTLGGPVTANTYTLPSDTAIEAASACTEKTNAKGWYTFTNTGTETGWHRIQVLDNAVTVGHFFVNLTNTSPTEDIAQDFVTDSLLDIASAVDGKTLRQALRYIAASVAGKISGAGTGTEVVKGLDGSTTRITATVDQSGNRTAMSYD